MERLIRLFTRGALGAAIAALLFLTAAAVPAAAQTDYPTKPIRMVVGFAAVVGLCAIRAALGRRRSMHPFLMLVTLLCAICSGAAEGQTIPQTSSQTIFQKNFYGDSSGTYVNHDQATGCPSPHASPTTNCNVSLNGADALPILINPWEPVSINILCTQVIFLPSGPVSANTMLFAGNSFSPDIMTWGVPKPTGAADPKMCYPPGTSFPFPAAAKDAPANKPGQNNFAVAHLDVHVQGQPSTVKYQVYLSVWYTKNPQ